MHGQEYRLAIRHKVWLDAGGTDLLRAIDATGSVRAGARSVGWSYRHVLAYLDNAERMLAAPWSSGPAAGRSAGARA